MATKTTEKKAKKVAEEVLVPIPEVVRHFGPEKGKFPKESPRSYESVELRKEIVTAVCQVQRKREICIKSRIMTYNRLRGIVAGDLGYFSRMEEKDRKAMMKAADKLISEVDKGLETESKLQDVILTTLIGVKAFDKMQAQLERSLNDLAKQLHVAGWEDDVDRKGISLLSVAKIVGEAGDLSNYPTVARLWKRFGTLPYCYLAVTKTGSAWRFSKDVKLSAEAWEDIGYSPRRRSIVYVITDTLLKCNKGSYRAVYDYQKQRFKDSHPGCTDQHAHRHGMLLMGRKFLKDLWVVWNGSPPNLELWREHVKDGDVAKL